jgi:hypothetical protein
MSPAWTDIDWTAPRPAASEIVASQEHLSYEPFDLDAPETRAVVDALTEAFSNGGPLLKGFRVLGGDSVLHWFASRNRYAEYGLLPHFLGSAAVREALPELQVPDPLGPELRFEESWSGTLTLDGELAATLKLGGAYGQFPGSAAEAKRLGAGFVDGVVGARHEDFRVYRSDAPWTPWFDNVAWDSTWVIIDNREQRLFLLCLTDTD